MGLHGARVSARQADLDDPTDVKIEENLTLLGIYHKVRANRLASLCRKLIDHFTTRTSIWSRIMLHEPLTCRACIVGLPNISLAT